MRDVGVTCSVDLCPRERRERVRRRRLFFCAIRAVLFFGWDFDYGRGVTFRASVFTDLQSQPREWRPLFRYKISP